MDNRHKKEIVALANTNGGRIFIGIDDNGKIVGLKNISKGIEALSSMIREGLKSSGVYLRFGNTSAPASEEVIKKMIMI